MALIRMNNFSEHDDRQVNTVELMANWQLWLGSTQQFITLDSGNNRLMLASGAIFAMQNPFRWYRIVDEPIYIGQAEIDVGGNFKDNTLYHLYLVDDDGDGTFILSEQDQSPVGLQTHQVLWVAQFMTLPGGIIDQASIIDSQMTKEGDFMAIGSPYVQYPGFPSPQELFPRQHWKEISSSFAGDFFRVAGGNATTFGGGRQSDSVPNVTGWVNFSSLNSYRLAINGGGVFILEDLNSSQIEPTASNSQNPTTSYTSLSFNASRSSASYGRRAEVAPQNQTIRIWRKVGNISGSATFALVDANNSFIDHVELLQDEAGYIGFNPNIHIEILPNKSDRLAKDGGSALVFSRVANAWQRLIDHRGKMAYKRDGSSRLISEIGDELAEDEIWEAPKQGDHT